MASPSKTIGSSSTDSFSLCIDPTASIEGGTFFVVSGNHLEGLEQISLCYNRKNTLLLRKCYADYNIKSTSYVLEKGQKVNPFIEGPCSIAFSTCRLSDMAYQTLVTKYPAGEKSITDENRSEFHKLLKAASEEIKGNWDWSTVYVMEGSQRNDFQGEWVLTGPPYQLTAKKTNEVYPMKKTRTSRIKPDPIKVQSECSDFPGLQKIGEIEHSQHSPFKPLHG